MTDYALPRPLAAALEDPRRTPEQKLIGAVVQRALVDTRPEIVFSNGFTSVRKKRLSFKKTAKKIIASDIYANLHLVRRDAVNWFNSNQDHPFSFLWCCEALGMSPSIFRRAVG